MKKLLAAAAAASVLALGVPPAQAQVAVESALAQYPGWTFGFGADYVQGKYDTNSNDNWTWTFPLTARYETGPWTFRAAISYVEAHGVNRDVGAAAPGAQLAVSDSPGTQSGLGDTYLSASYTVADPKKYPVGVDLAARVKIVTADKDNDLITTGNTDWSLQADFYQGFGPYTAFGVIGWTHKGNIDFIDRDRLVPSAANPAVLVPNPNFNQFLTQETKDPWYFAIGGSYKLTPETSLGASYDFRQKITDNGSEISEATVFVTHRITKEWKVQPYGVVGFTDGSPDWGLGAMFFYGF